MLTEYIKCIFLAQPLVGPDLQNFSWLLKNEHNRHYLIKHLQQPKFRKGKLHKLNGESFESLSTIVSVALIECDRSNDFYSSYLLARLSEHYYIKEEGGNKYLVCSIRDHGLWKKPEFWKYVFAYKCEKLMISNADALKKDDELISIVSDMIHMMCSLYMEATLIEAMIEFLGKASQLLASDVDMLKKMGVKMLKNMMYADNGEILF